MAGSLSSIPTPRLGAVAIKGALNRAGVAAEQVQEVFMGNVLSGGLGQAPARQAALYAGIPNTVPCTAINKVCASGMKAISLAATTIMTGQNDIVVAGGMENMSMTPYYLPKARQGMRLGHGEVMDGLITDGLWDVYNNYHMGIAAELCATTHQISREEQDAFAIESYKRAAAAQKNGFSEKEIVPVELDVRGKKTLVTTDEEVAKVDFAKLPTLRPVFKKDGTVTAANASSISDGAAAVVVMSGKKAKELGLRPLAKIRGFADAAHEPEFFTTAPSLAIPKALANAGVTKADVDFYEINQAFSVVSCTNLKLLDLDPARVDVFGGAVALGHPIGCSGARIVVTLLNVLDAKEGRIGCASVCNGGGGASALVLERL
eukprot:TRINITY_DN4312_c0_g1_i1.p1 TRINITY_DN4312_c0_g1~~TRINITY_DN4312_c0_g1_i1.p1  ORF type:complete len:433 (+),score=108.07 TRINITY_DN4312_c0_g1_i1:174-1301(+)